MSAKKLRCFLAVPVNNHVRDSILQWRKRVRHQLPNARWAKPENYHLTIKFYGDLDADRAERLAVALWEPLNAFKAFQLELQGLGAFPNWDHPRILWAGVGEGIEHMRHLAGVVEAASVGMELPADRRDYRPHLTLARFRVPALAKDIGPDVFDARRHSWGRFEIREAHMIRSRLTPNGPVYTIYETFTFKEKEAAGSALDNSGPTALQETRAHGRRWK